MRNDYSIMNYSNSDMESERIQWPDHFSNGGTGITRCVSSDPLPLSESIRLFGDSKIYMKEAGGVQEMHCSRERIDLSDFWAFHKQRMAGKDSEQ